MRQDRESRVFTSVDVTIALADLRGFSEVAASHPAGTVFEMLDRYLVRMSEIVARNSGMVDKFMGDSLMILFGAPQAAKDDVRNAIRCAVEMQIAMDALNADQRARGLPPLYMGIGINTGPVMAGVLGSEIYSEYTVVGEPVNLASRIESFSLRGQVLVSAATYEQLDGYASVGGPIEVTVKGGREPLWVREVLGIPSLGLEVPRHEVRKSPRVAVRLPTSYQLVRNKIVLPAVREGTILDIGYFGILADLDAKLASASDLKLDLDLSLVGRRASEIYGKTVRTVQRDGRALTGIEFTSLSPQNEADLRRFVQLLLQGLEER